MSGDVVTLDATHLTPEELAELQWAYQRLEHPSLAIRLSNYIGKPIEEGFKLLPKSWYEAIHSVVELSIRKSLDTAIGSMDLVNIKVTNNQFHKLLAAGSGAVGGFLGPLTLLAELPFMTMLILRSIAEIAQEQ
ncbi:MAG: EcsC family protein, partial [Gammaproteobacteria bacterium]